MAVHVHNRDIMAAAYSPDFLCVRLYITVHFDGPSGPKSLAAARTTEQASSGDGPPGRRGHVLWTNDLPTDSHW